MSIYFPDVSKILSDGNLYDNHYYKTKTKRIERRLNFRLRHSLESGNHVEKRNNDQCFPFTLLDIRHGLQSYNNAESANANFKLYKSFLRDSIGY